MVATTAEEAKNPSRDLPIGIIASLIICTVLYCAVAVVLTGMVRYDQLSAEASLATAFESVGKSGYATVISAGAVAGLTTVVMTLLIGTTRVVFAMSRDWLLPPWLGKTNPRTGTPLRICVIVGAVVALVAALTPVGKLEFMINIGTLSAFFLVSVAVPVLRRRRPDLQRPFRVPVQPCPAVAVGRHLRLPHAHPAGGDVDPVPHLDGPGVRHLLRLRLPQQPVVGNPEEGRAPRVSRAPESRVSRLGRMPCCHHPAYGRLGVMRISVVLDGRDLSVLVPFWCDGSRL